MAYTQDEIDAINHDYARTTHRGRPRIPLSERKFATSVYLDAATIDFLVALGGNLSRGITKAAELIKSQQESSLAAIKAAAERRDQSKVGGAFDD